MNFDVNGVEIIEFIELDNDYQKFNSITASQIVSIIIDIRYFLYIFFC